MLNVDPTLSHVVALELRLLDPRARADRREVEALLHPDFREVGASGRVWNRASVARELAADPGEPVEVSELAARQVREDVVLVTYLAARADGSSSWRSSLWVLGETGWSVLFHQGTPAPS